jgi:hypothetical protein
MVAHEVDVDASERDAGFAEKEESINLPWFLRA